MLGGTFHCLCNYNVVLFIMLVGKCLIQFHTISKGIFKKKSTNVSTLFKNVSEDVFKCENVFKEKNKSWL